LANDFPAEEYAIVDLTMRMFTEPVLRADTELLGRIWTAERERKIDLEAMLGVTAKELGSNERFAELLRAEGVGPAMKDGKNGHIYAFAKTDEFMRELIEDEDERIRALAEA